MSESTAAAQAKLIHALVLDATPLITQSASALQQYASVYYTTPGVRAELKDEHARNQLLLWGDLLQVRQPKQAFIDKVSAFAKLTGDYSVLSMNDVHIIALAYELQYEDSSDKFLRKVPGEKLESDTVPEPRPYTPRPRFQEQEPGQSEPQEDDDGFQTVTRKKNKKPWKHGKGRWPQATEKVAETLEVVAEAPEPTPEASVQAEPEATEKEDSSKSEDATKSEEAAESEDATEESGLQEEYDEEDDDGDWITPTNLQEVMLKDNNETVQDALVEQVIPVAISTGDFACQNVSMQIGLKLMNYASGMQIKRVRNYMYRCHACFLMFPLPKSGERKHFCAKCGGDTLLRCAVSIDERTGKVTPHLKKNFQWITKGQVYSVSSPLSKNAKKQQGRAGYQHNKENRHKNLQDPLILRADQKEYAQALKDDAWRRKKNEKLLQEWIGGGSADNFISPFGTSHRGADVRVGRGRNANAVKGKRK